MISVTKLTTLAKSKKYPKGTIFNRNGNSCSMYILLQGEVAVLDPADNSILSTVGPGDFFDDASVFLENGPHIITLAVSDVIALPIERDSVKELIAEDPELSFELIKAMCCRFHQLSADYETDCGHRWTGPKVPACDTSKPPKQPSKPKAQPAASKPTDKSNAAAPQPAVAEPQQNSKPVSVSSEFPLFPDGHQGSYMLPLPNDDRVHLMERECHCPYCHHKFKALKVKSSKLSLVRTDHDMRRIYQDIDPNYYDLTTCPECLFTSLSNMFEKPDITRGAFQDELKELKEKTNLAFDTHPASSVVFAQYYLALFCVSKCFMQSQLTKAKLLLKLSWLYHDCMDEQMETETVQQALNAYMDAYLELDIPEDQDQQLCLILGELHFKLGDLKQAKEYFHKAKLNRKGTPVLRNQAEDRLDEIKALERDL